jgi:hypothetical protein
LRAKEAELQLRQLRELESSVAHAQ